ncbi:hypothetical protein A3Q56_02103 [Intoshia linei]|uniref:4-hydroxybenzoate polyprenyltransferase, mitochondrial n=1 Tax=Intoshia linei TaxID=1819745 RepID=A0A177B771_9BILA|nr:hypothetical protein A3Q56_02103 [Intoshia linei]
MKLTYTLMNPFIKKRFSVTEKNIKKLYNVYIKRPILNSRIYDSKILSNFISINRIDKPAGFHLLYIPCTWGIAMMAENHTLCDIKLLSLLGIGAFLMRGSGCIINDIWDVDVDSQVSRTKNRPLASKNMQISTAVLILLPQLAISAFILSCFNESAIISGVMAVALVINYPLMKRFIPVPQLFLGFTFNYGIIMGALAVNPEIKTLLLILPLYLGSVFWTVLYDSIYGFQDMKYDKKIGMKSSSILFEHNYKTIFKICIGICASGMITTGLLMNIGISYYISVILFIIHLLNQTTRLNLNDTSDMMKIFKSNSHIGYIMLAGIICGKFL